LNAARNDTGNIRCGIITGKKIGNAVTRNRARRLMREAIRLRLPLLEQGWDMVWIGRAPLAEADYSAVLHSVDAALTRAKLFRIDALETANSQSRIIGMGTPESGTLSAQQDTGTARQP
jgi:ribonuclease P protein component